MINPDFDDERRLLKDTPVKLLMTEDLALYSLEALQSRLLALKGETDRTIQAVRNKEEAKKLADKFFK